MRRFLTIAAVSAGAAYAAAASYLFVFQRSYLFVPSGALASPAEKGLADVEVVALTAADGTRLAAWYGAPAAGRPSVLYFHGNAGNVSGRAERFRQIRASGFGLLALSYRGYGGSDGAPSERALVADGLAAFDWLAGRGGPIVIHGESLGTAVAVQTAAARPAAALVLEAPFTAAVDLAARRYPWVPVAYLMRDPFLSRHHIGRVEEPLLVVHGTDDPVVPVAQGRALFEAANEPKRLVVVDGAGHSDLWERGLWPALLDFLTETGVTG